MSEYAERDVIEQGDTYIKHVGAMTEEGLHRKAAIAAELAHRDIRIAALKAELAELKRQVQEIERIKREEAKYSYDAR